MAKAKTKRRPKGSGCVIKRGGYYYYRAINPATDRMTTTALMLNGLRCTTAEAAQTAAQEIAKERRKIDDLETRREMLAQVAQTKQLLASARYKVGDIWGEYTKNTASLDVSESRRHETERIIGRFVAWCGANGVESLADVDQDVVRRFLDVMGEGVSARSYNAYREILKCVFQRIYRSVGMEANPVEGIPTRKMATQSRKEFTPEQVEAIFRCFDTGFFFESVAAGAARKDGAPPKVVSVEYKPDFLEEYRIIMLMAVFTGCRLADACLMRWENIDLNGNSICYTPRKTARSSGKVVRIPLHPMLATALRNAEGWKDASGFVCPNVAERYRRNCSGVGKTIQKLIHYATGLKMTADSGEGRSRGASQYGMHSFRHTFVSFCANAGVPLAVVADIVGHGNPSMTEHYFHANMEVKAKAVEAIRLNAAGVPAVDERERLRDWVHSANDGEVARAVRLLEDAGLMIT